ncbi:MAG: hypothetical protein IJL71_01080 [Oscillospiraceae bacterium]|nr:hypothetical protein [Oscillospiraceae bacterium]
MKKKTRNFIIAAVIITAIIAGAVIICTAAANRHNNKAEYTALGDEEITRGHYIYFCTRGYDEAYSLTGISDASLFDAKIDGVKAEKWMENYAVSQAKRYLAANKMFDDAGLELTEEDKQALDDRFTEEWYNTGRISVYGPMGVEEDVYMDILTTEKKIEKLTEYYRDELEGQLTDSEIEDCFAENFASAVYVAMHYIDTESKSTLEEYEAYCEEVKNGRPAAELAKELRDSGKEYIVTSIDGETGKTDVVFERSGSIFPLNFIKELFAAEVGEAIFYDDSPNMIYVIAQKTDLLKDPSNLEAHRDEVVEILLSDLMESKIESEIDTYNFSVNKSSTGSIDIKELYGM